MPIPERIEPKKLADYLEVMTKAVFQASVSWKLIDDKWESFREVFSGFDPKTIADFTESDIEKLMSDERILRSRRKIDATIKNAKTMLELESKFGGFKDYLRSKSSYAELSADIRKKFKFVGELSAYYFLFRVKEPVPPFEEWITTIEGHHPRMKEMVELARESDPKAGL